MPPDGGQNQFQQLLEAEDPGTSQFEGFAGLLGGGGGNAHGLVAGRLIAEGLFHQAILDGPGSAHAPMGHGHFLNHAELDAIGGSEALDILGHEVVKALTGFVFQAHALGEEIVANGVGGRARFTLWGDGASGEGRVGARSIDSSE